MADSPAPDVRAQPPGPARPFARLGVTLGVVAVTVGLSRVPLAGVGAGLHGMGGVTPTSLLALGLTPILAAFVVIELSALVIPAWRPLRISGFAGRRQLTRLALLLAIPLTAAQTLGSVRALITLGRLPARVGPELVVAVSLAAAPFLLLGLASVVGRFGLGDGISVVLGSLIAAEGVPVLAHLAAGHARGQLDTTDLLLIAGVEGVLALDTVWTLRRRGRAEAPEGPVTLPLPTTGVVPLQALAWVAALIPSVALFVPALMPVAAHLMHGGRTAQEVLLVAVLVLGAAFAWAFSRPALVGDLVARARGIPEQAATVTGAARRALLIGTGHSLVFLLLVQVAFFFVAGLSPAMGLFGSVWIVVLAAVGMDGVYDWRFRARHGRVVAVRPLHRLYAVDPALEALDTAGIPALARGAAHRTLLQVVGPYVPITVMVPEQLATDATEVLELVLDGDGSTIPS